MDSSVLVTATLSTGGGSGRLVSLWLSGSGLEVIVSRRLLEETAGVLSRPKFARQTAGFNIDQRVAAFAHYGKFWPDAPEPAPATRDPNDDYLVSLALEAGVDALVSLDRDLLDLGSVSSGGSEIPVLTPGALLAQLAEAGQV